MKSFLEHVAEELLSRYGNDLSRVAVIFPNKRASLFLNEYLANLAGHPIWSPAYITISDLFRKQSKLKVADSILLICELHKCFIECTGIDETLDHFYGWGQLLLSDFDDLDKNMGPADHIFANVRDIHELDDISYLTKQQKEIIRRFFSNFSDDHNSELKKRFLRLWSHIGEIYHAFNERLEEQGLAYEGALYRRVATDETLQFEYETYVFVGFNWLQKVETTLIQRLQKQGKAIIYQDHAEIPPQQVTCISAPTENIQARYISQWLNAERIQAGRRTAIVLCNEGLLQSVIHSLPNEVEKVNITTGYPLLQTSIASFITSLINLQVNGYSLKKNAFRKSWMDNVNRHPYARLFSDTASFEHYTDNGELLHWLLSIIRIVANDLSEKSSLQSLDSESLFRMYTLLNRVKDLVDSGKLAVDMITLQRLINQLIQSTTIPFHGEPAEGVQVMGVLETRNLDFDHILLLSCNEGNMPKGVNDTSFIPYSIRKAYGLTTVDHKVAIYQHYFHRLLQRSQDVTIIYNNATTDGQKGEMSRFILQLMVETNIPISFQTLQAGQHLNIKNPKPIVKNNQVINILLDRFTKEHGGVSPTAISTYLRCQLRFFYHYISNIIEPDDNDDNLIDNRIFGNIFHKAAQTIYERLMAITGNYISTLSIDDILKNRIEIEQVVDNAIKSELFQMKDLSSPIPELDGLQIINREVIIKYLRQLLEIDRTLTPFSILGLEKLVSMSFDNITISGYIDRLDCVTDPETGIERIRVIDYKTGAHRLKSLPDVEAIFDPQYIKEHSDYYLQAFLYSHIVRQKTQKAVSPSLLFIQHAGVEKYDPTLCLGKDTIYDIATVSDHFMQLLNNKISEIFHPDIPFQPTEDRSRCRSCPYKIICGE